MSSHTFVVMAYKESAYLDECIQSLRFQTVPSEIILATSTPCSFIEGIADKHCLPLRINTGTQGIVGDWNFALSQAQTPYVTLAHQDDNYEGCYTEKMLAVAARRNDVLMVFSDYAEQVGGELKTSTPNLVVKRLLVALAFWGGTLIRSRFRKRLLLSFGSPIPCPSVMYHKALLGDFQFSSSFSINMDWDAWLRISSAQGSIGRVPEILQVHRLHQDSETSHGIADQRRASEDRVLFERLWPRPIAELLRRLYALSYAGNAVG